MLEAMGLLGMAGIVGLGGGVGKPGGGEICGPTCCLVAAPLCGAPEIFGGVGKPAAPEPNEGGFGGIGGAFDCL